MNDHLAKPFRQDELEALLMRHLKGKRLQPSVMASDPA